MNPRLCALLERTLVLLLALSFTLPLAVGGWLRFSGNRRPSTAWLRNATLGGVQVQPEVVPYSRHHVFSAKYQGAWSRNYDANFPGRELLIRVIDEIYLRIFHTAPGGVLVGPHDSLVELGYAEEYCLQRPGKDDLAPLAADLRRMQDCCDARGVAFALVVTPSKAAIYPENLPVDWRRRYKPGPRYYDEFTRLLREKGVRHVDGHRIAADLKPFATTAPVFPPGGIHWGDPAALATTNAVLKLLGGTDPRLETIRNFQTQVSNFPKNQDSDLATLLNTLFAPSYPVVTITVEPARARNPHPPTLAFVAGSFGWKMLDMLNDSRQFSEVDFYYYYLRSKHCGLRGELHEVASPVPPLNFNTDIFAADALVLEINEQSLPDPAHLAAFLRDALASAPDPRAGKAPFHYESRMFYQWGDTLTFGPGEHPVNPAAVTGFTEVGDLGAYTQGSVASLHLIAAPPPEAMVLEVKAGAFLVGGRLTKQRVTVCANGHPAGEWVWKDAAPAWRDMVIPKEFLTGDEVLLEFRIARPGSPAEFGISADPRMLGIDISSLRLRPVGEGGKRG